MKRLGAFGLGLLTTLSLSAGYGCTGDDPLGAGANDGGTGGEAGPGSEGGTRPTAPPTHAAAGVLFHNQDTTANKVEGIATIARAADESDVEEYVAYFGVSDTAKVGSGTPLGTFPKGKDEHTLSFPAGTDLPAGTTHLLVFTKNAAGESKTPVATSVQNLPSFVDLGAGLTGMPDVLATTSTSALLDPTGTKFLLLGNNDVERHPTAYVCNLDGTGCVYREICNTVENCATDPRAVFAANKLLLVGRFNGGANAVANTPWLYACDVGAENCAPPVNLAEGTFATAGCGEEANVLFDPGAQKLLVTTSSNEDPGTGRSGHALLFRSNPDGTGRSVVDITAAGGYTEGGYGARSILDPVNKRLIVVGNATSTSSTIWISTCTLDGAMCTAGVGSVGSSLLAGLGIHLLIDPASNKLLVFTRDTTGKPQLARCDLGTQNCGTAVTPIAPDQPNNSGAVISATFDRFNDKLLVFTQNDGQAGKPSLFRCARDGTACRFIDMSAGQGSQSGVSPNALVDERGRFALVLTSNADKAKRGALFRWGL